MTNKNVDITDYLSGTLSINGEKIEANLMLQVSNNKFIFGGLSEIIETDYRGIAFNYYNTENSEQPDNGVDNLVDLEIKFSIKKPENWSEGNPVRIMQINESESDTFKKLRPYFEERLKEFKYDHKTEIDHMKFNCRWNHKNPDNPVYDLITIQFPQSLDSTNLPRFTKRDGIFTLTQLK